MTDVIAADGDRIEVPKTGFASAAAGSLLHVLVHRRGVLRATGMGARLQRVSRRMARRLRTVRVVARALASPRHPVLAQMVATRRCNLSCAYCNEYDRTSAPVPAALLCHRVDRLADLGTSMVDITGGEPLLHPELESVIRHIRTRGMSAGLLTNGYLLTPARIERLNEAGLDRLQISIDNVTPSDASRKSLKVLDAKLQLLKAHADFDVNVNAVLGCGVGHPDDALAVARRALALGFGTSIGLVHDGSGHLAALSVRLREVHEEIATMTRSFYAHGHDQIFQRNLTRGMPNQWHCRAGARYLYVCEDGLVHWCSQQRGYPATPLDHYTAGDLEREFSTTKTCAPYCTVSCVHRVSLIDDLRERPQETLRALMGAHVEAGGRVPFTARLLAWSFVTGPHRLMMRRVAARVLRPS